MSDNVTSFLVPFLLGMLLCLMFKRKSVEYFSFPSTPDDLESDRNCDESFNFETAKSHAGRRQTRMIPNIPPRLFDASNRTNRVSVFHDELSGSEPRTFHSDRQQSFNEQSFNEPAFNEQSFHSDHEPAFNEPPFNEPPFNEQSFFSEHEPFYPMTSDGRSMGYVQQNILQVLDDSYPINQNIAISELPVERQEMVFLPNMNSRLASRQDMYDPRQVGGFGDPMRRYIHSTVGNPQYFYDDLDSETSFFTRNNIESEWFGSSSRRLEPPSKTNRNLSEMSLDSFIERTNNHRANMQSSMMSKRNAELMQLRKFPIYRGDQIPKF